MQKRSSFFSLIALTAVAGAVSAASLQVGATVPDFDLKAVDGKDVRYSQISGDITLITFISTQCPVSNGYNDRMRAIYDDYQSKGVKFVFINSNSTETAADVKEHAAKSNFAFKVYKDPANAVADQFGAQVTPEAFLVKDGKIVYRGRIDDALKGEIKEHSLRGALDSVLAGKALAKQETKAFGCTIKRVKAS